MIITNTRLLSYYYITCFHCPSLYARTILSIQHIPGVIVHSLQQFLTFLITPKTVGEEIYILHKEKDKVFFGGAILTTIPYILFNMVAQSLSMR